MMINIGSNESSSELSGIQREDVQPNAVDIRLGKVFRITDSPFIIDNDNNKTHRKVEEVLPNEDGFFELSPGLYEVVASNKITVGEDEAGFAIIRSTLNRAGLLLSSGLYDSGYSGVMAGCLRVPNLGENCNVLIEKDTRFAQIVMWKSKAVSKYSGSYGDHSEHDKKYQ